MVYHHIKINEFSKNDENIPKKGEECIEERSKFWAVPFLYSLT
jgi:hypothetical protein